VASGTRVELTRGQLDGLVRHMLGTDARVLSFRALGGGTVNTCLALTLARGPELILKVAPPPARAHLHYERDLLRCEVEFYRRAASAGVPVPSVVATDFSGATIASDCFVMTRLPGRPLWGIRWRLPRRDLDDIRRQLGRAAAHIGAVECPRFGHPAAATGTQASTWREALGRLLDAVLRDAARFRVALPIDRARISSLLASAAHALDAVTRPRLVHFDLWSGNVLVDLSGARPRLTGIIDGERSLWGDPWAEFAALSLFGDLASEGAVLDGWREVAPAPSPADRAAQQRVLLAQLYTYVVMLVEPVPRSVHRALRLANRIYVGGKLRGVLDRLAGLSGSAPRAPVPSTDGEATPP
jgi:aminoglycoside phosphotransferase (APT) family kinase protein